MTGARGEGDEGCRGGLTDSGGRGEGDEGCRGGLTDSMLERQLHFASQPMAQMVLNDGRRACGLRYKMRWQH
jgi:hypothetical protein